MPNLEPQSWIQFHLYHEDYRNVKIMTPYRSEHCSCSNVIPYFSLIIYELLFIHLHHVVPVSYSNCHVMARFEQRASRALTMRLQTSIETEARCTYCNDLQKIVEARKLIGKVPTCTHYIDFFLRALHRTADYTRKSGCTASTCGTFYKKR